MQFLESLKNFYITFSEFEKHFFQIAVTLFSFCIIPWLVRTTLSIFLNFRASGEKKAHEVKFIHRAQYFVGFLFSIFWFRYFDVYGWYSKLSEAGAAIFAVLMAHSILDFFEYKFSHRQNSGEIPIKPFAELIKLISVAILFFMMVAILLEIPPMALVSGVGAMSAILLLLFKDSILGTVTAVKINIHRLVRKGDWIEVGAYGADGEVKDITLSVVTVENWDKTTSIIPTYEILNVGLKNWRSMTTQGRRIKRNISLDVNSIRFLDMREIEALAKIPLIQEQITQLCHENDLVKVGDNLNKRCVTNASLFRLYVESYIKSRDDINNAHTLLVRQLDSSSQGVPIEIYCFTKDTNWCHFENVQSEIFEHLYAVVNLFDLKVYQHLTNIHGLIRS
ncbi:mechanosensitive ion channel family protein [Thaumasiovibrio sp. DFM-14]|uniref:mechanosensitive ion channel family protein n=1 Tax=Thaumasiovibrio sp. DFM-14 TaxID=3384792 RepID=UPI0039A24F26